MAEKELEKLKISRTFEQPDNAMSFYSDLAQITGTGNEVIIQFYETIPGSPDPEGNIKKVKTTLRANVIISFAHAKNLGKLLLEKIAAEGHK